MSVVSASVEFRERDFPFANGIHEDAPYAKRVIRIWEIAPFANGICDVEPFANGEFIRVW